MSDNGDTVKVICNVTMKDGMMNIHFDRSIAFPVIAMALRLLNKQFDKMLEKTVQQEKKIVELSPDIMNRIRMK